jgi:hypothetical protein
MRSECPLLSHWDINFGSSVRFGPRDPPRAVLASDEPALPILGVAVGVVRRFAEYDDLPVSSSHFMIRLLGRSLHNRYRPPPNQTGPSDQRIPPARRSTAALNIRHFAKLGSSTSTAGSGYRSVKPRLRRLLFFGLVLLRNGHGEITPALRLCIRLKTRSGNAVQAGPRLRTPNRF